jgi:hypothetical protein
VEPRLKIKLIQGWHLPEKMDPNAPVTYVRGINSGALQFSFAQLRSPGPITVTEESLTAICEKTAQKVQGRTEISRRSGTCQFGKFGTVAVSGDWPRHFQMWALSNGRDHIFVTHTCENREPIQQEVLEADQIALMTTLG